MKDKIIKVLIGITMMIVPNFLYIYLVSEGLLSGVVDVIAIIITVVLIFSGFILIGVTLTSGSGKTTIYIGGKKIDNEILENLNKMSLYEKLKKLNIFNTIGKLIFYILLFALICFIMIDPYNFFDQFKEPGKIQILVLFGIVFIVNGIYLYRLISPKNDKIRNIIILFILLALGYFLMFYV